jgi:hypothetical protein
MNAARRMREKLEEFGFDEVAVKSSVLWHVVCLMIVSLTLEYQMNAEYVRSFCGLA